MSGRCLRLTRQLLEDTRIEVPVLCGPMFPGSNPELVAAVSECGGLGVVQPLSLTQLYGATSLREGLREIRRLTKAPIGVNLTLLANARYKHQVDEWLDVAIEEQVDFLLTSLGKPDDVARKARSHGMKVYHDVHTPAVAAKVVDHVDGLICLNNSMGGQTGSLAAADFINQLPAAIRDHVPLVCAGGVASPQDLARALDMGYAGAQCGTRFLATRECKVSEAYKRAIVRATREDIVWTNKMSGTNASVIRTDAVAKGGLEVNPLFSLLLRTPATKTWMRTLLLARSLQRYSRAAFEDDVEYWQAGTGMQSIDAIEPVSAIMSRFRTASHVPA